VKYRTLGRTGIEVSPYCLGTMMFGAWGNPDHDDSIRIIHRALEAGINFVDTADVYSHGESEEIVGKALKGRRDDVALASEVHYPMGDDPNHAGNSRRWIIAGVEKSLRRLQTDHLGPRTMEQLDDLLAGADVILDDDVLDRIDEIAPPGTHAGPNDVAYTPPAISSERLRRRPVAERSAA
jgi:aryl-alcohol dehydrogenase-like predicted oxidoreductase